MGGKFGGRVKRVGGVKNYKLPIIKLVRVM